MKKPFYDYNLYLQEQFGEKIHKISINAGFSCPNIDGTTARGGCIYCNNASFSPPIQQALGDVADQLARGVERVKQIRKVNKFLAYFQAYTNTHAPVDVLERTFRPVVDHPDVVGLVIGTRPDALDPDKVRLLADMAQHTYISLELGVQSIHHHTLQWINRGDTVESFRRALELVAGRGLHVCAHIMLGFPTETREQMMASALAMNQPAINGIKLHNLLIVKDTKLARMYESKPFGMLSFAEYTHLVGDILERLRPDLVIERLCAVTYPTYLIAPKWNKSTAQITTAIIDELRRRRTAQGIFFQPAE